MPGPRAPEPTDLLDRLPHAAPARLPDTVVQLRQGESVVARRTLRAGDACLNEQGWLPTMLLVELMAQVGGLLIEEPAGGNAPYGLLAGIRNLRLHAAARAGDTIIVECYLSRQLGTLYQVDARSRTAERDLAQGTIHISQARGPS